MLPAIVAPRFARLDDFAGLWAMAEDRFIGMWRMAERIDLASHIQEHKNDELRVIVEKVPVAGGTNVAVIRLSGVLMKAQMSFGGTSTIQARREIRAAVADPDVGGILLLIDSPGGTVAGTDDLAADVKAAGRVKPVWSHVDDLAASAAYWVASQTARITANSSTALVGSIGTLQVLYDTSAAYEKAGVRALVLRTGSLKGLGVEGAPITEEQITHLQHLVDAVQISFDSAVRGGRGLSAKELAAVRHGGVLTGDDAKGAKLIDAIQPLSRTLNQLAQEIKGGSMSASVHPDYPPHMRAAMEPMERSWRRLAGKSTAQDDEEEKEARRKAAEEEEEDTGTLPEEEDDEEDETGAMDDDEEARAEGDEEEDADGGTLPEEDDEEDPEAMDDEDEQEAADEDDEEEKPAARKRK